MVPTVHSLSLSKCPKKMTKFKLQKSVKINLNYIQIMHIFKARSRHRSVKFQKNRRSCLHKARTPIEGRKAKNYVPPFFFEKEGDKQGNSKYTDIHSLSPCPPPHPKVLVPFLCGWYNVCVRLVYVIFKII